MLRSTLRVAPRGAAIVLLIAGALGGCGASAAHRPTAPVSIDETSFAEARRRYLELAPDAPERAELRARLVAYLARQSDAVVQGGDYEEIVQHLRRMTALLAPADFSGAPLPEELGPLAQYVAINGARRGDEARVLAAELLLARLDAEHQGTHLAEYERVSRWGREARTPASADILAVVESGVGLVDVWEEHARLTPAPEVLDRLATVYIGLRDALSGPNVESGFRPPRGGRDMEHLGSDEDRPDQVRGGERILPHQRPNPLRLAKSPRPSCEARNAPIIALAPSCGPR